MTDRQAQLRRGISDIIRLDDDDYCDHLFDDDYKDHRLDDYYDHTKS